MSLWAVCLLALVAADNSNNDVISSHRSNLGGVLSTSRNDNDNGASLPLPTGNERRSLLLVLSRRLRGKDTKENQLQPCGSCPQQSTSSTDKSPCQQGCEAERRERQRREEEEKRREEQAKQEAEQEKQRAERLKKETKKQELNSWVVAPLRNPTLPPDQDELEVEADAVVNKPVEFPRGPAALRLPGEPEYVDR